MTTAIHEHGALEAHHPNAVLVDATGQYGDDPLRGTALGLALVEHRALGIERIAGEDIFEWFLVAGSAKMLLGEFAEASAWLRKSIDANRNRPLAFFLLAACLAHLGRLDEARREVKAGLTVDPDLTLRRFRAGAQSDNAVYLAQRARVIEGMRLAGVPEG